MSKHPTNEGELNLTDRLAIDRTRLASDRNLMAWIRTGLSMIAFGFTICKFLEAMQAQSPVPVLRPDAPRNAGLLIVCIGNFSIVVGVIQHWKYVRKLGPGLSGGGWDLGITVAVLVGLLGILIFVGMVYMRGPFS